MIYHFSVQPKAKIYTVKPLGRMSILMCARRLGQLDSAVLHTRHGVVALEVEAVVQQVHHRLLDEVFHRVRDRVVEGDVPGGPRIHAA